MKINKFIINLFISFALFCILVIAAVSFGEQETVKLINKREKEFLEYIKNRFLFEENIINKSKEKIVEVTKNIDEIYSKIEQIIDKNDKLDSEILKEMALKNEMDGINIINKKGSIIYSSNLKEINFNFININEEYYDFLKNNMGRGIKDYYFDKKSLLIRKTFYQSVYYFPLDKDYVVECYIDVNNYMKKNGYSSLSDNFLFQNKELNILYLKECEIFSEGTSLNNFKKWDLSLEKENLLKENGSIKIKNKNQVEYYYKLINIYATNVSNFKDVTIKCVYNFNELKDMKRGIFFKTLFIAIIMSILFSVFYTKFEIKIRKRIYEDIGDDINKEIGNNSVVTCRNENVFQDIIKLINNYKEISQLNINQKIKIEEKNEQITSEMKVYEEKSKQLEEENKAKIKFMASISNELRNPLNGIVGMSEILLNSNLDEKQKKYIQKLRESSDMLIAIINDLLYITELEENQIKMEYEELELKKTIENIVYESKDEANRKGLEYVYKISSDIPEWVVSDKNKIKKIFGSFLNNAVKFTNYGTVFIDIRVVYQDEDYSELEFIIEDTGIGIEKEKFEKLFIPFSNSKFDFNRKYSGIGMGIVIAKKLIEIMGGNLYFESNEGDGTKVKFRIKFKTLFKQFKNITDIGLRFENMECMMIGDDENNTYMNIFESAGIRVFRVKNLAEAYDILEYAEKYDFIVYETDKNYIEDIESMKKIYEINKDERIILILGNYNSLKESTKNMDYNDITEFILKPAGKEEIISTLTYSINKKAEKEMEEDIREIKRMNLSGKKNIMIVEDNDVNRIAIKTLIEKRGYGTIIAENGAVAIKLFNLNDIDLILMDIQMPVMDGYEATKKIREIEKMYNKRIPIIGVTAYSSEENRKKCFEVGMDDYIAKPIKVDKLYEIIEKY